MSHVCMLVWSRQAPLVVQKTPLRESLPLFFTLVNLRRRERRKKTTGLAFWLTCPEELLPACPFAMVPKRGAALALLGSCALLVAVIVISGRGQESSELLLKVDMMAHEPYSPPSNMWVSPLSPPPPSFSLSSLSPFLSLFPSLTLIPPLFKVECSHASRKSCRVVEGSFSTLVAGAGHDHVWSSCEEIGRIQSRTTIDATWSLNVVSTCRRYLWWGDTTNHRMEGAGEHIRHLFSMVQTPHPPPHTCVTRNAHCYK